MAITIELRNYDDVLRGLKECKRNMAKGTRRGLHDLARRGAKTVVGTEVAKVYNIKSGEVKSKFTGYKVVGSVVLEGVRIDTYELEWKGHALTPVHFQMSALKRGTVKWKPLKQGGRIVLKSTDYPQFDAFVAKGLPWTRTPSTRAKKLAPGRWSGQPVEVVHSHLAVPQMIDNEKVQPHIEAEISKRLEAAIAKISL